MKSTVIELNNISKRYKKDLAVKNINIKIEKGSIYGLVGENGSGKSTILKILMGTIYPTEGDLELFGDREKNKINSHRMKIGSLIETPEFYPYMTGQENLEYYRIIQGIKEENIVDKTLRLVGLEKVRDKKYKDYSLGMKQRLGIGLAIMAEPEILVLDEPINGLDPKGIVEVRNIILELNREKATTIILSSHILGELSQVATDYGFINNGIILEEISARELENKCRKYLSIKTKDIEKATVVLERELKTLNYKVKNSNEIQVFDYIEESDRLIKTFIEHDIEIKSIAEKGVELEDYYLDLIGGGKYA